MSPYKWYKNFLSIRQKISPTSPLTVEKLTNYRNTEVFRITIFG